MQNLIAQALVERILRAARSNEKFKVNWTRANFSHFTYRQPRLLLSFQKSLGFQEMSRTRLQLELSSLDSTGLSIAVETVYMRRSGRRDMNR